MINVRGSAERLAAVRIGLSVVLAIRMARPLYRELAAQPAGLFQPRSFMSLLDSMPSLGVVIAVQILCVGAAICAAVGFRARVTLPVAWAGGVFLGTMASSAGKIVHNDALLLLVMVPLLVAPVDHALAIRRRSPRVPAEAPAEAPAPAPAPAPATTLATATANYDWPIIVAMIVVAGSYFFTGWQKLATSGWSWIGTENMRWIMYSSNDAQATPNWWALLVAGRAWLSHAAGVATLLVELGFVLTLWKTRLAMLFVPAAVGLHLGILLAMRLDYTAQIATVSIVFIDWPALARRVTRARPDRLATMV